MATSSSLFFATIYNQSQLAERKHVARYWSINTAATAVPLSALPLSVSYYNEISGGHIGRAVVRRRCSAGPLLPLWVRLIQFLVSDRSSSVGLCTQGYKSLHIAITIRAALVNTQPGYTISSARRAKSETFAFSV